LGGTQCVGDGELCRRELSADEGQSGTVATCAVGPLGSPTRIATARTRGMMKNPPTKTKRPARPAALTLAQHETGINVSIQLPGLPAIASACPVNWSSVTRVDEDDVMLTFGQHHPDAPSMTTFVAIQVPAATVVNALDDSPFASVVIGNLGGRSIDAPSLSIKDALHPDAHIRFDRAQFMTIDVLGIETAIRFFRIRPTESRMAIENAGDRAANGIDASSDGLHAVIQLCMSTLDFAKFWRRFAKVVQEAKDPFDDR